MIFSLIVVGLVFLTAVGYLVLHKLKLWRYHQTIEALKGNGEELLKHLIDECHIEGIELDPTRYVNAFDEEKRLLKFDPFWLRRNSITAIANAAYLMSLVLFHQRFPEMYDQYRRLDKKADHAEKVFVALFGFMPFLVPAFRVPQLFALYVFLIFSAYLYALGMRLWQLPLERRITQDIALPLVVQGEYIDEGLHDALIDALDAKAKTKLAGTIAMLFNIKRWISILKR